jgi:cytochrome c oxidase subunit II
VKNKSVIPFTALGAVLIAWGLHALFTRFPTMPEAASAQAAFVDGAWNGLLVVEGAVYALVMAFLIYCLLNFRAASREEQGDAFDSSRGGLVETLWLLTSVAITLSLAALGAHELRAIVNDPSADIDVEVRASQFSWEFYYPKFNQYGAKLFMERGKRHRLILTSKDVVHSFWVPEFRTKQDAVPGKAIPMIVTPTKNGEYTILCNQICGWGHTEMLGLDNEDFEEQMKAEF